MGKPRQHKWDFITDTCIICGLKKRVSIGRVKGGYLSKGRVTEYLVKDVWTKELPDCILSTIIDR